MDERKRALKGSPALDAFKQWHKTLDDDLYASDFDLVLVSKKPARIIAVVDYKRPGDCVSFAEGVAYDDLIMRGIPVYIVTATWSEGRKVPFTRFTVQRLVWANWRPDPPECDFEAVLLDVSWRKFRQWEVDLRERFARSGGNQR